MFAKYLKIWANYLKVRAKMAPNVVCFCKIGTQHVENHTKTFFMGTIPKDGVQGLCGRKYSHNELPETFSGKFAEIQAKKSFALPKIYLLLHLCTQLRKSTGSRK